MENHFIKPTEFPISVFLFLADLNRSVCTKHQYVDNWMCLKINDVLMSACVHAVATVTHLHIHNTHEHVHTRFMHDTVLDPVKASGLLRFT